MSPGPDAFRRKDPHLALDPALDPDLERCHDLGTLDVAWPLAHGSTGLFLAAKLAEACRGDRWSSDDLSALALQLMRCGPPVGWLGAMLLMSRRDRD